ncbi:hypothetical protein [Priestia megaterium]|uniref:hypothetical protein n=1 Tax=Priestia megaterium TaxID=1404 RepID=UPI00101B90D2|nr:hypothetical protein [Priestia megaterium]
MTLINSGTCVGVLYRANTGASCRNGYCVHNGRLVGGVISSNAGTLTVTRSIDNTKLQTYNGILLSHRAVNRTTGQVT